MAPGDAQLDDASGCLVSQGANSRCGFIRGGIAMRGWRAGERVNRSCSHRSVSAIFHPACNTWLPSFRDGRLIVEWLSRELWRVVAKTRLLQNLIVDWECIERGRDSLRLVLDSVIFLVLLSNVRLIEFSFSFFSRRVCNVIKSIISVA